MALYKIIPFFVACVALANAACTNDPPPSKSWCYSGSCGPQSNEWSPLCHQGQSQTPIDHPNVIFTTGSFSLRLLQSYTGSKFTLTNNGHTVNVDFAGEGPSTNPFPFPSPLQVTNRDPAGQNIRPYKLAAAHFHWGSKNNRGSEHCVAGRCHAMEIHFVHHLANYNSPAEALASCDEGALAVIGVFFDVSPINGAPGSPLAPIAKHLDQVRDPGTSREFNETLDFSPFFASEDSRMFTYKGSLTTPGCNEQVSWFVLRRPVLIPREEMNAFRTKLVDSHHETMVDNYRPLQQRNGRDVIFSDVFPTQ